MSLFRDLLSLHGFPSEPMFARRYGQTYGSRVAAARAPDPRRPVAPGPAEAEPEPASCRQCPA